MNENDLWIPKESTDVKYWRNKYPILDQVTAEALFEESDGGDEIWAIPSLMFCMGHHLYKSSPTDQQLQEWSGNTDADRPLTPQQRAGLFAKVTQRIVYNWQDESDAFGNVIHFSELIQALSLQELQEEAAAVNISTGAGGGNFVSNKTNLVLALVKHVFDLA